MFDESKEYTQTFWKTDLDYMDYSLNMHSNSYEVTNESELVEAFENLYKNNDYKMQDSLRSIADVFGDVGNSSQNIVDSLYIFLY